MNPTALGLFSVIVWGISLAFMRMIEEQIGMVAYTGITFMAGGMMALASHMIRRQPFPSKRIFRNPHLYIRWISFLAHEGLLVIGIAIVQRNHVPFLILINYLWPTATILCSILIAGVRITRWWAFMLGSLIVIGSMCIEIVGSAGLSLDLFSQRMDCLAYFFVFVGAVSWGIYSALSRREAESTGGSAVIPMFQMTFGLLLPVSFLPGVSTWNHLTSWGMPMLIGFSFFQFLAYMSWDLGMRRGNVVILSLCADFIPWLSLLAANVMLGVSISDKTVISAISLVAGAMVTRYGTLRKKALPDEPFEMPEP